MVEGDGFEPSKAEPADLQSAPFGHSGTPPEALLIYINKRKTRFPNTSPKCGAHLIKLAPSVNHFFYLFELNAVFLGKEGSKSSFSSYNPPQINMNTIFIL